MKKTKPKAPVYVLAEHTRSQDTIEALEKLLDLARQGEVIGLAAITLHRNHRFGNVYTGEACNQPLKALGAAYILLEDITKAIRED